MVVTSSRQPPPVTTCDLDLNPSPCGRKRLIKAWPPVKEKQTFSKSKNHQISFQTREHIHLIWTIISAVVHWLDVDSRWGRTWTCIMRFPDDKISPQIQQSDLCGEAAGARRHCAWKIAGCEKQGEMQLRPSPWRPKLLLSLEAWKRNENRVHCELRTSSSTTSCKVLAGTPQALGGATTVAAANLARPLKVATETWVLHHTEKNPPSLSKDTVLRRDRCTLGAVFTVGRT